MSATVLKEKAVAELWWRYLAGQTDLTTEDGGPDKVVYPGMVNAGRGGDFCRFRSWRIWRLSG